MADLADFQVNMVRAATVLDEAVRLHRETAGRGTPMAEVYAQTCSYRAAVELGPQMAAIMLAAAIEKLAALPEP